jgi:outer membrane lipoprotein LolB
MRRLSSLLLLFMAVACAPAPLRPLPDITPERSWQLRQQPLRQLTHWQLSGRLAVQNGHEAWHMSLEWQQRQDRYSLNIIAPLGQGSMQLHGDASQVMLMTEEGETINASTPELLLDQQLGWKVPVSALRYWVLGLPAPGDYQPTLDEYGRLSHLLQDDWEIEFIDYQPQLGVELPRKVFISNHLAAVKLVISNWQPLPATSHSDAGAESAN